MIPDPLILPDGSIIVAAVRSSVTPPSYRLNFERVEANGDVTTFSNTTFIATSGLRPQCNVLVLSPDGLAFYSAGVFRTMHGFSVTNFAKMSIDGTLDTNFVAQISGSAGVSHLAFQSNGKILLAGAMGPNPAGGVRNVLRLNPDGSVDGEFQVPSFERLISTVSIKDFFVDRFDRLLVAGNFFTVNGTNKTSLARLLPNGALDASFHFATPFTDGLSSMKPDPTGRIIVAGDFLFIDRVPRRYLGRIYNEFVGSPEIKATRSGVEQLILNWPTFSDGFVLESASELGGAWNTSEGEVAIDSAKVFIQIQSTNAAGYFRLSRMNSVNLLR